MVEDFRSRMSELLQEMGRLDRQAADLEEVVRKQQAQLEEMDLLVRQRDEQLAEQQGRVEELEATLKEREEELAGLRERLSEQDATIAGQQQEIASLRAQLTQREGVIQTLEEELGRREAGEMALREQLALVEAEEPPPEKGLAQALLERFVGLETLLQQQGEALFFLREELIRLHGRVEQIEAGLTALPAAIPIAAPAVVEIAPPEVVEMVAPPEVVEMVAPPEVVEVAPPPEAEVVAPPEVVEMVAPPEVVEVAPPPEVVEMVAPPEVVEVAPPPEAEVVVPPEVVEEVVPPEVVEVVAPPEEAVEAAPWLVPLYDVLGMVPRARVVGLAGRDGLGVERVARGEVDLEALEVELAGLVVSARQTSAALQAGPLLTLAFQIGGDHCFLSPVGGDYFAFLLTEITSVNDFRQAQAVLLQAASRLAEFL